MKHLFRFHSSITYLSTLSIIAEEHLPIEDCILLSDSRLGFQEVLPIPIYYRSEEPSLKKHLKAAQRLRKFVENKCDEDGFILYAPGMHMTSRILCTSKKCRGFRIFEEGISAYMRNNDMEDIACEYGIEKPWTVNDFKSFMNEVKTMISLAANGITLKLLSLPCHYVIYTHNKDILFYAFSQNTFPLAHNKKVLSMRNELTLKLDSKLNLEGQYVWISSKIFMKENIDILYSHYQTKLKKYLSNVHVSHIFIKFHQFESQFSKDKTFELFNSLGITYTIITDDVMMEVEFLHNKNVTVISDVSSLLLYNVLSGNKSVSVVKGVEHIHYVSEDFYETMKGVEFI